MPEARAPLAVLATRQIAARPAFAVLQVSALSGQLLALVLLLLRTDLIEPGGARDAAGRAEPLRHQRAAPEQGKSSRPLPAAG